MFCSKCGKELTGKERFCPRCGNKVAVFEDKVKVQKKRHIGRKALRTLVCIVFLAAIGIAAYQIIIHVVSGEQYLAIVQKENGKWGYINEKGKEVIPCEYDFASSKWTKGLTVIGEKTGEAFKYGVINDKGKMIIEPEYADFCMGNGIIALAEQIGIDEMESPVLKWGFFDSKGRQITDFKYQIPNYPYSDNENGLIVVTDMPDENDLRCSYGVLDSEGKEVLPLEYSYIPLFTTNGNKGMICVEKKIGNGYRYGFVNYNNEVAIHFKYEDAMPFSDNGLAAVCQDEKWGYINTEEKEVLPFVYDDADNFSKHGLAFVEQNGEYQCIDEKGATVISSDRYRQYGKWVGATWIGTDGEFAELKIEKESGDTMDIIINKNGDVVVEGKNYITPLYDSVAYTLYEYEDVGDEEPIHRFMTPDGKLMHNTYDYAGCFSENKMCVVGEKTGIDKEGKKRYRYSYIDPNEKTVFELPEEYIFAGGFVPVDKQ